VSTTLVDITFRNNGQNSVTPLLQSQIIPAGFGIFVGPSNCQEGPSGCNPNDPLLGNPSRTFNDFSYNGPLINGQTEYVLASASFSFLIYADKLDAMGNLDPANRYLAYSLTGDLALILNTADNSRRLVENIAAAEAGLKGFRRLSEIGSDDFLGFQWDTTDILVNFRPDTLLAPGESATLTYETIVQSSTNSNCRSGPAGCLVSYASFGDPIGQGRGGGGSALSASLSAMSSMSALGDLTASSTTIPPVGSDPEGLLFGQFAFFIPTVEGGVLTYVLDPTSVPEPDNWAMMIAGFGLVGATLRRRRRLVA
jgi:hypothetical protein